MTIAELLRESHRIAREKGWWDADIPERTFGDFVSLMHTEVSEAFEEYRNGHAYDEIYHVTDKAGVGKPEGIPVELADLFIRVADFCERYGVPIETALREKMAYNKTRPHRHGGKVC